MLQVSTGMPVPIMLTSAPAINPGIKADTQGTESDEPPEKRARSSQGDT